MTREVCHDRSQGESGKNQAGAQQFPAFFRKITTEKKDEEIRHALEHDNDSGLSSVDEYVYLKQKETNGK